MNVTTMPSTFRFYFVDQVIATAFKDLCKTLNIFLTNRVKIFSLVAELVARMEEEKTAIHTEYEQERIAYQKLLKEYNMLEAANDDLKEKVNKLRGGKNDGSLYQSVNHHFLFVLR